MMQKVLVIDDDKITHSFIKRALKQQYTLIHAYDGEQGIKSCLDLNPDMILLDVEMPGKNGYEVCEILLRISQLFFYPETVALIILC